MVLVPKWKKWQCKLCCSIRLNNYNKLLKAIHVPVTLRSILWWRLRQILWVWKLGHNTKTDRDLEMMCISFPQRNRLQVDTIILAVISHSNAFELKHFKRQRVRTTDDTDNIWYPTIDLDFLPAPPHGCIHDQLDFFSVSAAHVYCLTYDIFLAYLQCPSSFQLT